MTIGEILWSVPEVLTFYLEHLSQLAILAFDEEGNIEDCNQGLLRMLGLSEKPLGKRVTDLFSFNVRNLSLPKDEGYVLVDFQFLGDSSFRVSLSGYLFHLGKRYLLIVEKHQLTCDEILAKMSLLNNQLADLTRDLSKKNQDLKKANARIRKIMNTDPLTGLFNRRSFRKTLSRAMAFARRQSFPLSLVMIDIDHFKVINDTFGHTTGDRVLKKFASILRQSCRQEDVVARFGGEEFAVLLLNTDASSASSWAERVRIKIENTRMLTPYRRITASFGITEFQSSDTEQNFIKRADDALYEAKKKGRNRWVVVEAVDARG
ncbi:MAG: sensor domain-containing diguanylate cyclase [Atribacterota bacterium]|nr:sensor domain-containing diguanylate cyclase [Atribacterota bacterium]